MTDCHHAIDRTSPRWDIWPNSILVSCMHCGSEGSVSLDSGDIEWGN